MIVYKTTNLINNKIYVGKDSKNNPKYYGSGRILLLAIKKYGKDNFKKEIIEHCKNLKELSDREVFWITELKSTDRGVGYNILIHSGGGKNWDGPHPMKGKNISDEVKKKISLSHMGKTLSKEHRESISKNHHDVTGENNPMFGKTHTDEVREIIRNAHTGRIANKETKLKMSLMRRGEGNSRSKLTKEQVIEIRRLFFDENIKQSVLAREYNVLLPCIGKIVKYINWKHI